MIQICHLAYLYQLESGNDIMKKLISIILILTMFTSVIYPCQSVIAAEIKQNNALTVSENIIKMTDEYNTEYEEKLDNSVSESITVDNRLIVETKSKINTYDSVDEVYGMLLFSLIMRKMLKRQHLSIKSKA